MSESEENELAVPPKVPSDPVPELTKEQRINLINRRSIAYLLEITVWYLAFTPLVVAIYLNNNVAALADLERLANAGEQWHQPYWLTALVWFPYFFYRDRFGGRVSWGKRFLSLDIARVDGSDHPVSNGNRSVRNLVMLIPIFPLIEYCVAYYGNKKMQRMGDKWAGTYVVEADVAKPRIGSYSAALLGTVLLFGFVYGSLAPQLTVFWFKTLI
jgi:uncharacterized RDD family membrane protein YckC